MITNKETRRILVALTEAGAVQRLWQALIDTVGGASGAEIEVIFVADDRWSRAASLPFTREVLTITGATRDFTPQRAAEIIDEAAGRTRSEFESLASASGFSLTFQIVRKIDEAQLEKLAVTDSVIVAPSELAGSPVVALFERLACNIVLVETGR